MTEEAGPSCTNKSDNKGESKPRDSIHRTPPSLSIPRAAQPNTPTKPKSIGRRTSIEIIGDSPNSEPADRVSEAKKQLIKGKAHLNNSRNLRADIKAEVLQALDRLYQLVKEAERDGRKGKVETTANKTLKIGDEDEDRVNNETENIKKLIQENAKKIDELKEAIVNQNQRTQTYASVTAYSKPKMPDRTTMHSMVITSKQETETGDEVLNRIRKAVITDEEDMEGWTTVDRVRKAKDRKIIVGCKSVEERNKLRKKIERVDTNLQIEEVKNKDPLLILKDVLAVNSNEEVLKLLRAQNRDIFQGLSKDEDRVEIVYRKKARNPHNSHVIIKLSPALWNRMLRAETVRVDIKRIQVADQSPLVQCSTCLGYGHSKRLCKETLPRCSHCAGQHIRANCEEWLAGTTPVCCNCTHAKMEGVEHNAFSQECPIRRKWEALARARVAYC